METLQRTANRGSISTGYDIDNSVKLEADNGEKFISSQFGSAGNQKTWTISFWVKITELGAYQMYWGCFDTYQYKGTDDKMYINFRGGAENFFLATNRVFRDTSAWYHFVVVCDATNSTNTDRGRLYINGVRETDYQLDTYNNLDSNDNTYWNGANVHSVGGQNGSSTFDVSGYMAEFHSVDGQALDPTDFGEFDDDTGIWKPKEYTGSYGTNGFYLDFENSSDLGDDVSGNSKAFTNTNITSADQATDTPTNNFCIINTIEYTGGYTYTNGGTQAHRNSNTSWYSTTSTMGVSRGKWYWEAQFASGATSFMAGVSIDSYISTQANPFDGQYLGSGTGDGGFGYNNGGNVYYNDTVTISYGSAPGTNIMGFAIDMDNEKAYVSINGTWQNSGDPTSGATGTGAIDLNLDSSGDTAFFSLSAYNPNYTHKINFGGYTTISISSAASDANGYGNFEYAPPTGYYSLCTKNLAEYG